MCGLFGWIRPGAKTTTSLDLAEIFREGMVQSQIRGEDATGFYTPKLGIVKETISPDEFVNDLVPDSIADERFILGHCRKASAKFRKDVLNIQNPKNAQPFESSNWILTHNGTIDTPKIKGYNYTSNTDSEVIIAYAEKTSITNALSSIDGSATVVLYDKKNHRITFWTNGQRPLAMTFYKGIIFYASTKSILRDTLEPKMNYQIFPEISYAVIYECEPLTYDLKRNRFSRQKLIKPKPAAKAKSNIIRRYNNNTAQFDSPFFTERRTLQKGCTQNPR